MHKLVGLMGIAGALCVGAAEPTLGEWLKKPMLPHHRMTSYTTTFNRLVELDTAADEAWLNLKDRAAFDAYRKTMRAKMIEAVGGFFEKTPLNAKTVKTIAREGYTIEKVLFETLPGVHETGLLYLPNGAKKETPVPVVVITCGHSNNGKGCDDYQRGCVQATKAGMAAFIYDPYEQGERVQEPKGKTIGSTGGHCSIGLRAALLGGSMAQLRLWDGMRAIDYVQSRPEIDGTKIGYMGNSGGGTMTSLMMAVEPRITAAAPCCYLTSLRELCDHMGPQDGEQNIFGQLAFGLNHAGYIQLQDIPVAVSCCYNDMFNFYGTRYSYTMAERCAAQTGRAGRYALASVPGPHGWKESVRQAGIDWMRAHLKGEKNLLPLDMPKYRMLDIGFRVEDSDHGLDDPDYNVTPTGSVLDLPGERTIYDVLRDKLAAADKARKTRTATETAALVKRLAGVKLPAERPLAVKEIGTSYPTNGLTLTKVAFVYPEGLAIPGVLAVPALWSKAKELPVLIVAQKGRAAMQAEVEKYVAQNRAVLAVDLFAFGELGGCKHKFYSETTDEGIAVMMYLMGESIIGQRASEILSIAAFMRGRFGAAPQVVAQGTAAIAAAHARAVDAKALAGVDCIDAPTSWRAYYDDMVRHSFANIVNGALLHYDWVDLLK